METKLKRLLKIRRISQKKLYQMICKKYETPIGLDALSQIINGKKLNYHLNTLVKICKTLKVQPHSVVESEILHNQLKKQNLTIDYSNHPEPIKLPEMNTTHKIN